MRRGKFILTMTHHAQARLQQSGIPHTVIENLFDFGHEANDHFGSRILYFDHRAREAAAPAGRCSCTRLEPGGREIFMTRIP
jgi:hypothetical protein